MSRNPQEIYELMRRVTEDDKELIARAYLFAEKAHEGQNRFSGEPYINHSFEVAKILAGLKADPETISAGLLHDVLEDTKTIEEEIKKEFGPKILFLIQGVTKLGKVRYRGLERHVESLRKFFIAMAQDIRVVMIKLADRLHNIQTLDYVPVEKQKRIALETLEIYAPIANRLGMWKLKGMLEDISFKYVYPKEYEAVVKLRKTKGKETLRRLEKVYRHLQKTLAKNNLTHVQIDYRIKYLYSLYLKLQKKNMDIDQIYDISAIRIIVGSVAECYQVLGLIHSLWRPVPGKLKDYIATPKPNGYQSIHTAVFTGDGIVEIQIRDSHMHSEAEYGVASHIAYDESGKTKAGGSLNKKTQWIKELLEMQKNIEHGEDFLDLVKNDFLKATIFVFTPKGDVIELIKGATALDFAYAIHSDIGNHAKGATVNGKFVSIDTKLKNHDVVKIEMSDKNHPTLKWLDYTETNNAKRHIRAYIHRTSTKPKIKLLPKIKLFRRSKKI